VVTCRVEAANGNGPWILSMVYGANLRLDRRKMLLELVNVKGLLDALPWLIA
jgi:hypothetical protein